MPSRTVLASLVLAASLAACATSPAAREAARSASPAPGKGFAYKPGTLRYRIHVTTEITRVAMGQSMADSGSVTRVVSVNVAPRGGDTLAVSYTVDSATTTHAQAKEMVAAQKGKQVSGAISPLGAVLAFDVPAADSTQPLMKAALESYRHFFPRIPSGAVKVGDSWTDTVTQKFESGAIAGASQMVLTSRVTGDTTYAGRPAWRIQRDGQVTIQGSGTQNGQEIVLEGSGTVKGASFLSPGGIYLGASETQNVDVTVQAPGINLTMPMTQRISSRTELIGTP